MDLESWSFGDVLDSVAAKTPTPGGGAVASAVGALAASLAAMVVNYTVGKKSFAAHEERLRGSVERLRQGRRLLLQLAAEDAESYGAMNELMRLPEDDERRRRELPEVAAAAVAAPRATIAACADLLRLFEELLPITNRMLRSDLAIAVILAESAARASRWNVMINLPTLAELGDESGPGLLEETDAVLADAAARTVRVLRGCE